MREVGFVERSLRAGSRTCLVASSLVAACGSQKGGVFDNGVGGAAATEDASASGSSGGGSSGGGSSSGFNLSDSGAPPPPDSACKGGHYQGAFAGSYSSNLVVGIPLMVTGNVDMTLNQAGNPQATCTFVGETDKCSNFFEVSGGTITGVANSTMIADSSVGGYPYFCSLTGTLDCTTKKLVGGWIQCTYCVGQLADGGMMCAPLIGGLGGGIGGQFAGPITADYDTGTFSFVNGTWNGAEALAGTDGGSPDGGPIAGLALDGGYGIGNYGGSGTWNAMHQ